MKFEELGLNEKTLAALQKLGYLEPTEVQQKTIPALIAGHNLLVRSQTGTGKTAAFGIGLIERIIAGKSKKALVLTPTRELAVQVCNEIRGIGQMSDLRVHVVYGGQSLERQVQDMHGGVDILVATPGRLLDLGRRGAVHIKEFDVIVLDEADMMLDMGFIDEVGEILDQLPEQRLSVLLSATLEADILAIANKYVKHPKIIEIGQKEVAETVVEEYVEATDREKFSHLVSILKTHAHMKILIFRETKMGSDRLQQRLYERGFKVGVLQGDMSQAKRNSVLAAFKSSAINVLVATNVAARGLHIGDLGLVVNYDKAQTEEIHLHRVGRTGRMSTEGKAITFVNRPESRAERMSNDHPDFAWMKQGGLDSYRSGAERRQGPMQRRGPSSYHRGPPRGPNEYGSGIEQRPRFGERGPRREGQSGERGPRREARPYPERAPTPHLGERAPRTPQYSGESAPGEHPHEPAPRREAHPHAREMAPRSEERSERRESHKESAGDQGRAAGESQTQEHQPTHHREYQYRPDNQPESRQGAEPRPRPEPERRVDYRPEPQQVEPQRRPDSENRVDYRPEPQRGSEAQRSPERHPRSGYGQQRRPEHHRAESEGTGQHFERNRSAPSHRYMPHEIDAPKESPRAERGPPGEEHGRRRRRLRPFSHHSR